VAFNLGNAIGAYIGGLPLQAGLGYQYPALIGAPLALVGFILLTLFYKKYEPKKA
jgi:DHA1 family arabinose polymer transporter-like MFS transporter